MDAEKNAELATLKAEMASVRNELISVKKEVGRVKRSDKAQTRKLQQQQASIAAFMICISLGVVATMPNLNPELKAALDKMGIALITTGVLGAASIGTNQIVMPSEQHPDEKDDEGEGDDT